MCHVPQFVYYPALIMQYTGHSLSRTYRTHAHTRPPPPTPHSAHSIIKILVPLRGQGWTLLSPAPPLADARGLGKRVRCPKGESSTGSRQNGFDAHLALASAVAPAMMRPTPARVYSLQDSGTLDEPECA